MRPPAHSALVLPQPALHAAAVTSRIEISPGYHLSRPGGVEFRCRILTWNRLHNDTYVQPRHKKSDFCRGADPSSSTAANAQLDALTFLPWHGQLESRSDGGFYLLEVLKMGILSLRSLPKNTLMLEKFQVDVPSRCRREEATLQPYNRLGSSVF